MPQNRQGPHVLEGSSYVNPDGEENAEKEQHGKKKHHDQQRKPALGFE